MSRKWSAGRVRAERRDEDRHDVTVSESDADRDIESAHIPSARRDFPNLDDPESRDTTPLAFAYRKHASPRGQSWTSSLFTAWHKRRISNTSSAPFLMDDVRANRMRRVTLSHRALTITKMQNSERVNWITNIPKRRFPNKHSFLHKRSWS